MKTFIICVVIVLIPSVICWLICAGLNKAAKNCKQHAQQLIAAFSKARHFDAKVASTEILMGWTVLMLVPTDGKTTGFYLKTTRRDIKEGAVFSCTEIPEHPEREFVLKNAQIKPDDSGLMIFTSDYERMMGKIRQEEAEGNQFLHFRQRVQMFWWFAVLPVCAIICVILFIVRRNMGIL